MMKGRSRKQEIYDLCEKHPRLSVAQIAEKYKIPYNTVWKHHRMWQAMKNNQPIIVRKKVSDKDVRMATVVGFVLGVVFTVISAIAGGFINV